MSIFLILSVIACSATIVSSVTLAVGIRKMQKLGDMEIGDAAGGPLVSIVVPACNEEDNIEKSLLSLLAQDYQNLEIIVVNDRSTDNTAQILNQLKGRFSQLIVHEIAELPQGWMGKSHALSKGAALAGGKYLVFTDADVVLEKTTIARAVGYMTNNRLDHLTLIFKNMTPGWLLNSLILDAGMGLLFVFRPWLVKRSGNRCFVGIGAFNMVKRSVYHEIGGHEGIKMHPIDDMMLGKTIKEHGFSQDCLLAYDFVQIPWYDSVSAMINGLQKNMFALVHYRLLLIPVLLSAVIVASILPVWGAILGDKYVQIICLLTVGIRLITFYQGLRLQGLPGHYLPGFVITPYISCYIIFKSAFVTMKNGGILWRGQHYALADLRKTTPFLY
jgi:glycosyltransferase involved in cell wall biosynthesis